MMLTSLRAFTVRVAALVALVVALAVLLPAHAAHASPDDMLANVNIERRAHGVSALSRAAELDRVAQAWSQHMASTGRLEHNPNYTTQVTNWRSIAENVGYAQSESAVHTLLMNSPGHRANILNGAFSEIGIGIAWAGPRVWVTQVFRQPRTVASPVGEYYKARHSPVIYRVTPTGRYHVSYEEWAAAGYPVPKPTPTDYVRYPWSPYVYAVTFWGSGWQWEDVNYPQWAQAGFPAVRHAGWIDGSSVFGWVGDPRLYLRDPQGQDHHLTPAEWAATGYRPPVLR